MADTRLVVEYPPLRRHREELAERKRARARRLLLIVPASLLLVIAAASASPPLAVFLAGIAALVVFFAALPGSSSVDPGQLAGVEGEAAVLERLERLPEDYLILNRARVPDETLTNGERELDFIVAGPSGLWVVEVKNTPGHLRVEPVSKHWPLARRAGCGSRPSWNAMRNPIPQARAQVAALERWLLKNGISARARALIVMAHPEVVVENARAAEIPVLVRDEIESYLSSATGASRLDPSVVSQLADLR
jgi:hypothetical protein